MGVLGLWRLLDATGKPVPLETLEGKVLAIDISIWIHQVIQGYQDRRGSALPNAHLIGLFNRLCKLMYFKIRPIFVFDGGVPLLKKNTIATRRKLKSAASSKAQKLKNELINNLIKHTAVKDALNKDNVEAEGSATQKFRDASAIPSSSNEIDIYKLPMLTSPQKPTNSEDYIDSDNENLNRSPHKQSKWMGNIHSVDVNTCEFQSLPADVRYDILTDLKETRKQSSWAKIHELPAGSDKYAGFQMKRLLKRRYVQESLEKAEKEMGGRTLTLEELDKLLTDQGINTTQHDDAPYRIASDSITRVLYASDKPLSQNSKKNNESSEDSNGGAQNETLEKNLLLNDAESMSVHSDNSIAIVDDINAYDFDDWNSDGDFDDSTINESIMNESHVLPKSSIPKSVMNPALAYMLEHSGFTRDQVLKIVDTTKKNKQKSESNSSSGSKKVLKKSKSNKKENLFRTLVSASPKIKEKVCDLEILSTAESNSNSEKCVEIPTKMVGQSLTQNNAESYSEDDDFIEILDKSENKKLNNSSDNLHKTITKEFSDSESDDFVEVQDVSIPELLTVKKKESNCIQVTIKPNEELKNDIFADIFVEHEIIKKENVIDKDNPEVVDKISHDIFQKNEKLLESKIETPLNHVTNAIFEENKSKFDQFASESATFGPQKNEDLETNSCITDCDNLTTKMTPEEILKQIKSTLQDIKTAFNEKESENFIVDEEQKHHIDNLKEVVEEKIHQILEKNKDISSDDTHKNPESNLQPDVIEELFKDNDFGKDAEEVTVIEKDSTSIILPQDEKELESMKQQLETEQQQIAGSLGKLERQAVDVTDQMRLEAQELLRLFGYPYIVAPMEAEAQCAYLEQIKLTDGTVTDDSDIWLFGGHCVYKNFFDNNKKVLQFLSEDIEHHYNLTRKEMILLALLVGSDYTNGLAGVGPVTALEILASFPIEGEDILRGLRTFCYWLKAGQLKAPSKISLRNKLKNVQIERGFPSQAVVQAYMCPMVDESNEAFSWGKPNLTLLADYVKQKFGWTKLKFDEIMNPILKKLSENKSQKVLESYFKIQIVPKSIESAMSKRVQTAIQKLSGKSLEDIDDEKLSTITKTKKKIEKLKKARKTGIGKQNKTKPKTHDVSETIGLNEIEEKTSAEGISNDSTENKLKIDEVAKKKPRKIGIRKRKKTKDSSDDVSSTADLNKNVEEIFVTEKVSSYFDDNAGVISDKPSTSQQNLDEISERSKKIDTLEETEQSDCTVAKRRKICVEHAADEIIPQRERDKVNALKTKLKAIEIYRKSKIGLNKVKKTKKIVKKLKKDAELSESSDSN